MKEKLKRLCALALSGTLCLGLAACGDPESTGSETGTLAQELGYGYQSSFTTLDDMKLDYINSSDAVNGKLYLCGSNYDADENGTHLYERDLETGKTSEIPLPKLESSDYVSESIQMLSMLPDASGYWVIINRYTSAPDGDEEDSAQSDAEGSNEESEINTETLVGDGDQYFAKKCDRNGNVLLEIDLQMISEAQGYFYADAMLQDEQGILYVASNQTIFTFAQDGTHQADIDCTEMSVQSMTASGDGTVVVSGWAIDTEGTLLYRLENGKLVPLTVEGINVTGGCSLYRGDGSTVLMSDGSLLYALDVASGQATKLLSWLDSDINGSNIECLTATDADTVLVLLSSYQNGSGNYLQELGTLTKTPVDQIPERTILTMGTESFDSDLQEAIIRFNRNSDTYRITLVDYSTYNTEDDYTAGAKQMERDIIAGSAPDILYLSSDSNVDKYISKGALADLSAMIDQDSSISMDDLVAGPLKAYQRDGKLYAMPFSFSMNTLYASAKLVGDRDSWTLSDVKQIVEGLDDGVEIMMNTSQSEFLNAIVCWNMNQLVDYGKTTCNFDSDTFKNMLELAKQLPESLDTDDSDDTVISDGDEMQKLQSGEQLMAYSYGGSSDSQGIKMKYSVYNREHGLVPIGYPTDDGNGVMLSVSNALAISAGCKEQAAVWSFIKTFLADDFQENLYELPVRKQAFDKILEQAMEPEYYTDENGKKVPVESITYIGEVEYPVKELTQAQAEDFRACVDGASIAGRYDTSILEIVAEEASAYFAGDKTADETAALIQSRVSIYLGESE